MNYSTIIKKCVTLEEKSLKIFGNKSKKAKKFILACEEKSYFYKLELYHLLIKNGFDYNFIDLESPIFLKNDDTGYRNHMPTFFTQKFLRSLQQIYTNNIILRMIKDVDYDLDNRYIKHSVKVLYQIEKDELILKKLKRRNIKTFKYLHTHLHRLATLLDFADFNLDQNDKVIGLNNTTFKVGNDKIRIQVPNSKFDLIECSNEFDFCIGTEESYGRLIKEGIYSYISVYKNDRPLQGILFDENRIVESYNYGGNECDFQIKHKIRSLLFKSNKIQAHSSWISHFEYEDGILKMVTKKQKEFSYKVSETIVNDLENADSRGSYYSTMIKGRFLSLE